MCWSHSPVFVDWISSRHVWRLNCFIVITFNGDNWLMNIIAVWNIWTCDVRNNSPVIFGQISNPWTLPRERLDHWLITYVYALILGIIFLVQFAYWTPISLVTAYICLCFDSVYSTIVLSPFFHYHDAIVVFF